MLKKCDKIWNDEFAQRTVFYWAKMYTENLKKGEMYTKLPKCITINLVGQGFKLNNLLHSEYRVLEKHLYTELSDELEIHFLNLTKANNGQTADAGSAPNTKTARLMRLENLGIDLISKVTGLSKAEIAEL